MASFNLLTEPWIPVVLSGTDRVQEVGLTELLRRSKEIQKILGDTPLETVSLNRLALALWLRIFGEQTQKESEWRKFWDMRDSPDMAEIIDAVDKYADAHHADFDLLHPERPFYQWKSLPAFLDAENTPSAPSRIFSEESSGNNPTLFSHDLDATARLVPLSKAARGIVTAHATALQGGKSKPFYLADAPLVSGTIFWLRGASFYEAMLLNSPPIPNARMMNDEKDSPNWERPIGEADERGIRGYMDYLTFQSRRILLNVVEDEQGESYANGVWFAQGDKIKGRIGDDPLMAYKAVEKSETGELPLKMRSGRALWRDSSIYYNLKRDRTNQLGHAPRTFEWVANTPYLGRDRWDCDAFSLVNNKGAIELWRHEQLPLLIEFKVPKQFLALDSLLKHADEQAINLTYACKVTAGKILYPDKTLKSLNKLQKQEATTLAKSWQAEALYWAALELPFLRTVEQIAKDQDTEGLIHQWQESLITLAKSAFSDATQSLDQGARNLFALAQGTKNLFPVKDYIDRKKAEKEQLKAEVEAT